MNGWRLRSLCQEGVRALGANEIRFAILFVFIAATASLTVLASLQASGRSIRLQHQLEQRGVNVVVVRSSSNIAWSQCAQFSLGRGVDRVGGVVESSQQRLIPGGSQRVEMVTYAGDLLDIWTGTTQPPKPFARSVSIGASLAAEIGAAVGSRFLVTDIDGRGAIEANVAEVVDTSARVPTSDRSIFVRTAPPARVAECWVEFAQRPDAVALTYLSASLFDTSTGESLGDVEIRPLLRATELTRDPLLEFRSRPSRNFWLVGAVGVGLVMALVSWTRRREMALYRAVGTRASHFVILAIVEAGIAVALGSLLGASAGVVLSYLLSGNSLFEEYLIAGRSLLLGALAQFVVIPLVSGAFSFGSAFKNLKLQ